jgi:hypothetical protein
MKRSEALVGLSHEHHHGLFAAQRLRRATAETAVEAIEGFLAFWSAEGRAHFQAEEALAERELRELAEALERAEHGR